MVRKSQYLPVVNSMRVFVLAHSQPAHAIFFVSEILISVAATVLAKESHDSELSANAKLNCGCPHPNIYPQITQITQIRTQVLNERSNQRICVICVICG